MALPRVLELEVMDRPDEAWDYDTIDHQAVNESFVADLLAEASVSGDVLDVGTGTALIPVELCRRAAACRVLAIDLAVHMLDLARYHIETAGLTARITLGQLDAKKLPFAEPTFDVVLSNSIVHHIPEPREVLCEAARVTRPGGRLFFRDLLRPDDEATVDSLVATYAGQANARQQQMFRDSLRAALTLEEIRALVVELGFSPEQVQATSDRHWTWSTRM